MFSTLSLKGGYTLTQIWVSVLSKLSINSSEVSNLTPFVKIFILHLLLYINLIILIYSNKFLFNKGSPPYIITDFKFAFILFRYSISDLKVLMGIRYVH